VKLTLKKYCLNNWEKVTHRVRSIKVYRMFNITVLKDNGNRWYGRKVLWKKVKPNQESKNNNTLCF